MAGGRWLSLGRGDSIIHRLSHNQIGGLRSCQRGLSVMLWALCSTVGDLDAAAADLELYSHKFLWLRHCFLKILHHFSKQSSNVRGY